MGSVKRKSVEQGPSTPTPPPQKQHKDNNNSHNNTLIVTNDDVDAGIACVHDVSYPENYVSVHRRSNSGEDSKPAKEFPFTLDPFQSEAINCLNAGESVMVTFFIFSTIICLYIYLIFVVVVTC